MPRTASPPRSPKQQRTRAAAQEGSSSLATTVRLTPRNAAGLRMLNAQLERPINKLINEAVAEYIDSRANRLQRRLKTVLANLEAYRRRDPGFEEAIAKFVEAEVRFEDDAEGRVVEPAVGPAVSMVREALRGR